MLAVLAGVLATPAAAQADAFTDVFTDYQKDGRIDACAHSQADLRAAKGRIPNDIEQYSPDFPDALDGAIEDRARSACPSPAAAAAKTTAAPATTTPPTATVPDPVATTELAAPATTVPQPPGAAQPSRAAADGAIVNAASRTADRGADEVPAPLVVLAVVGALVLLGLLVWGLARFFAWDPAWMAGSRHAIAEAGWRAGGLWDDFTDWLRPGRRGGAA
jgi:cobalamin biosynthesis Mg chelatase CobN